MPTIQGKIALLHLLFTVLLLCVILSQVSANRKHAKRNRPRRQASSSSTKSTSALSEAFYKRSLNNSTGKILLEVTQDLCLLKWRFYMGKYRAHMGRSSSPEIECKDDRKTHGTCVKLIKELGLQVCDTKISQLKAKLERSCAATCHFCGKPPTDCRRNPYGCCWDAHTPRGDVYGLTGCPECKDHLKLCQRFRKFCYHSKKSENRAFIELHCPLTCGRCKRKRNAQRTGAKVQMKDWLRV